MDSEVRIVSTYLTKSRFSYGWPLSLLTFAICTFMSNVYWSTSHSSHYLAASPTTVFNNGELWRIFTSCFIHSDLNHLLSNSLMLIGMGYYVTSHYGFLIYPVISFLLGGLTNLVVLLTFKDNHTLVGASGVVYFLWGFWLVLYILIQKHISLNRRMMKVVAVGIFFLVPTTLVYNVSYLAHAVGLVFGVCAGTFYYIINRKLIISYQKKIVIEECSDESEYDDNPEIYH